MENVLKIIGVILGGLALAALVIFGGSLLMAYPVKWLWNYLMPYLFNLPEIGAWKAFCLLLLCGFLFKSTITNKSKE